MKTKLSDRFFSRSAAEVAENLIGATLRVNGKRGKKEAVILGMKAFEGGDITRRREGMNYPPATIFLMSFRGHTFLNITTDRGNKPSCVMVNKIMLKEDGKETLVEGPGRVSKYLGVNKSWDCVSLGREIWIEKDGNNQSSKRKSTSKQAENCIANFEA